MCIRRCRTWLVIAAGSLLAACAPTVSPPISSPPISPSVALSAMPAGFPLLHYQQAQAQGRKIFSVDSSRSLVIIDVRRGGPFARLGHDHVVASHHVGGYVDPDGAQADLIVPLDRLTVDELELRAEAKLDTQPSPDDIAGTRRNMLGKVLDAERFPYALIHIVPASPERSLLQVAITLHGMTRSFTVPVQYRADKDSVAVSGRMSFRQTDFGMVPMSVLGGAIQVQDELQLRFEIHAGR